MQAVRKPAQLKPQGETKVCEQAERYAGADRRRRTSADEVASSPALALRHHLTARLEELAQVPAYRAGVLVEPSIKLPMQARVAIILGLSVSLWAGLYLTVAAII